MNPAVKGCPRRDDPLERDDPVLHRPSIAATGASPPETCVFAQAVREWAGC